MLVSVKGRFRVNGNSDLDIATDQVMDALMAIEESDASMSDSDVTAELTKRLVTVSVMVEADTWEEGNRKGTAALRSAIESANGRVLDPPALNSHTTSMQYVRQAQESELVGA